MKTKTIYRDAVTGKIVTAKYAKENPDTTTKETMKVAPKKAIELIREFQEWRRGAEIPMPNPTEIGKAIDEILDYFK